MSCRNLTTEDLGFISYTHNNTLIHLASLPCMTYTRVARTDVGRYFVSTCAIMFCDYFETMVFETAAGWAGVSGYTRRADTYGEAVDNHLEVVEELRANTQNDK